MTNHLDQLNDIIEISLAESEVFYSTVAPIILFAVRKNNHLVDQVAKNLGLLGVMSPSSAIHSLLAKAWQGPLLVTSANRPGEPMFILSQQVCQYFGEACSGYLHHERRIARRVDDSIVRLIEGRLRVQRSGRGYAPYYQQFDASSQQLALGGHQKNSFCLAAGSSLVVSQHMGDLESTACCKILHSSTIDIAKLLRVSPQEVLCDHNPHYGSSLLARHYKKDCKTIAHHKAHVWSCAGEYRFMGRALALAWDGHGLGEDGQSWGGEFFKFDGCEGMVHRMASIFSFPLIGGDQAMREPRRSAVSLAWKTYGKNWEKIIEDPCLKHIIKDFPHLARKVLPKIVEQAAMTTSSIGRLFDAIASVLGLIQVCSFEGQAAMLVESLCDTKIPFRPYSYRIIPRNDSCLIFDWRPMLLAIVRDLKNFESQNLIASRFHHTLCAWVLDMVAKLEVDHVLVSGGVFQNKFLTECLSQQLKALGVQLVIPCLVPVNDGGLALGQIFAHTYSRKEPPCA